MIAHQERPGGTVNGDVFMNCTPKVGHKDQRLEVQFYGKELFTEEFKRMVVQYVLKGHTRREASEKFGVSCTPIEKWVNLYKLHGTEGLLSRNLVGRQKGFWIKEFSKVCPERKFVWIMRS